MRAQDSYEDRLKMVEMHDDVLKRIESAIKKKQSIEGVTRPLSSRQHKKQKRSPKYPKAVCAICAGCFLLVVVGKPLSQRGAKRRTEKGACRGARPVTQYTLHGIP